MKSEQLRPNPNVTVVGPNVLRMELPVNIPGLGHVNAYGLVDEMGVTVVDPGMPTPMSVVTLRRRLGSVGINPKRIHTLVITHSHPDHFGGVRAVVRRSGAHVIGHASFRAWWDRHASDDLGEHPTPDWYVQSAGQMPWHSAEDQSALQRLGARVAGRARGIVGAPRPDRTVVDGEELILGGRPWRVVHTPGHTLDHICLYDPVERLLISGDHVLPTITPHIAGVGSGPDPLADFIGSLDRVAALDVAKVLPAHGDPFPNLGDRVSVIKRHHDERLERLAGIVAEIGPATVRDLSRGLFSPSRWGFIAESETFAHLEHLRRAGRIVRIESGGRLLYDRA